MNTTQVLSASTLIGNQVRNPEGERLGRIEDIVIDLDAGRIAYAVLSFGGFLGIGDKLFALPWSALALDQEAEEFVLDVDKDMLKRAPGFDKDDWPNMADRHWGTEIHRYYRRTPYWEETV
jgi:sporulation protein YlmC with PRC-barrel domain